MIIYDILKKKEIFQGFKFYVAWSKRGHWFAHCSFKEKLTRESEETGETPREALENLISEMELRKKAHEKKLNELTKIIDEMRDCLEKVDELKDRLPVNHEEYLNKLCNIPKTF